ncbi:MAG: hypothetical protein V4507_07580 [Verrucomicrobiota bacterium]
MSKWGNGHARNFGWDLDPDDRWFDARHGDAAYVIDGKGILTASGNGPRMYVNDPEKNVEWDENQEITVYYQRESETKEVSYSGPQIFTHTNHGTLLVDGVTKEEKAPADTRGYGVKMNINGSFAFEKEIKHGVSYATNALVRPWDRFPIGQWVGIKYVIRSLENKSKVKLQVYRDLTEGVNGGKWELISEFIDDGTNFGGGMEPCYPGVDPAMVLLRSKTLAQSESKKPEIAVYFRHEYGAMKYSKASIREIDPLP